MNKMRLLTNGIAVLNGGDQLSSEVQARGLVSDLMVRDLLPHIHVGDWVIDVGAALGDHTRAYLDAVGPTGKVLAFEPHPEFFACLAHNCPEAMRINRAVYNERDKEFLLRSPQENVGAGFLTLDPNGAPTDSFYPVRTVRLDDYGLDKLNFMKLDCEGAEYFVLLGAQETIKRCRPVITSEVNTHHMRGQGVDLMDFYRLIDSLGYDHKSIRNQPDRYCTMCDILAWPK